MVVGVVSVYPQGPKLQLGDVRKTLRKSPKGDGRFTSGVSDVWDPPGHGEERGGRKGKRARGTRRRCGRRGDLGPV